jgi:enamine deaminase RidA (YjgF/YER057c/UK114 family)
MKMKMPRAASQSLILAAVLIGGWTIHAAATGIVHAPAKIARVPAANPAAPLATAVIVPAGAKMYYLSGVIPDMADVTAPQGSVQSYGDTATQVASVLAKVKVTLASLGLTFGDVVQAHVFLAGDPAKNGDMDFAGLNVAWLKEFGTATQPNKPARVTVKVAGLAAPGALVEIEFVAAKIK